VCYWIIVITIKLSLWLYVIICRIHIILLFGWKMSKSTKIAHTRSSDYSDEKQFTKAYSSAFSYTLAEISLFAKHTPTWLIPQLVTPSFGFSRISTAKRILLTFTATRLLLLVSRWGHRGYECDRHKRHSVPPPPPSKHLAKTDGCKLAVPSRYKWSI